MFHEGETLTECFAGAYCLKVVDKLIGGTTAILFHCSGSCPTWMAFVAKPLGGCRNPSRSPFKSKYWWSVLEINKKLSLNQSHVTTKEINFVTIRQQIIKTISGQGVLFYTRIQSALQCIYLCDFEKKIPDSSVICLLINFFIRQASNCGAD